MTVSGKISIIRDIDHKDCLACRWGHFDGRKQYCPFVRCVKFHIEKKGGEAYAPKQNT